MFKINMDIIFCLLLFRMNIYRVNLNAWYKNKLINDRKMMKCVMCDIITCWRDRIEMIFM